MYYVYEWFIVATNEIIYVGKGTRRRYKVRKHNAIFNDMIKRIECSSRIIKWFDSEEEAFAYEYSRINELKREGQCVCNIHEGGYGGTTKWWTDEKREHYSQHNVMKDDIQRQRMREKNPMKIPDIALRTNSLKRRAVIIDDVEYESVKAVAETYNTSYDVIANWCRKGINPKGQQCRFKDSEQVEFRDSKYNLGSSKPMSYKGKHYESVVACARDIHVSQGTLNKWLKRGYDTKGNPCRFDDDTRTNPFETPYKGKPAVPVIINGIWYPSIGEAATNLHVAKNTLYAYLQGRRKSTKYICVYDNQQPSQGNTSESTLEGSETNG